MRQIWGDGIFCSQNFLVTFPSAEPSGRECDEANWGRWHLLLPNLPAELTRAELLSTKLTAPDLALLGLNFVNLSMLDLNLSPLNVRSIG